MSINLEKRNNNVESYFSKILNIVRSIFGKIIVLSPFLFNLYWGFHLLYTGQCSGILNVISIIIFIIECLVAVILIFSHIGEILDVAIKCLLFVWSGFKRYNK